MSVGIVSSATIDAIVHAAIKHELCMFNERDYSRSPQELGQLLANMNFESYECRYGIRKDDKYEYRFLDADYTPAEMLGSCRCYRYQACESPNFYESGIPEWLQQVQDAIGDRAEIESEYGKLPWGIGRMWR